jgi:hypothetical protein
MSKKLYFSEYNEEFCYPLSHWKDYLEWNQLESILLMEAVVDTDKSYFFCDHYGDIADAYLYPCGKICDGYKPINKVSGKCKQKGSCYEQTENKFLLKKGKRLIKINK